MKSSFPREDVSQVLSRKGEAMCEEKGGGEGEDRSHEQQ
jgi:hypothetical protein